MAAAEARGGTFRLETPATSRIAEVADQLGLEVVDTQLPFIANPENVLDEHVAPELGANLYLNIRSVLAPTDANYSARYLRFTGTVLAEALNDRQKRMEAILKDPGFYGAISKKVIPAHIVGIENLGGIPSSQRLPDVPGLNLPAQSRDVSGDFRITHDVDIYPDLTIARLGVRDGKRKVRVNGDYFKPTRTALTAKDSWHAPKAVTEMC